MFILGCGSFVNLEKNELRKASRNKFNIKLEVSAKLSKNREYSIEKEEAGSIQKNASYCSDLGEVVYERQLSCDAYSFLFHSLNLSEFKDKEKADFTVNIKFQYRSGAGIPRVIWSWASLATATLIPYWDYKDYLISAEVYNGNKEKVKEYEFKNDILYLRFLPLIFYMPFSEYSEHQAYIKTHRNLIERLSISMINDKIIEREK